MAAILICALHYSPLFSQNSITDDSLLGEYQQFDVKYGIFKVGKAELYIDYEFRYPENESPYYLISFKAKSTGFLRFLYSDVDVCFESLVSAIDTSPLQTYRERKNGKKASWHYDYFHFDDSLNVKTVNVLKGKESLKSYDKQKVIKDALGAYVYFREMDMSSLSKSQTLYCYLSRKLNKVVVIPSEAVPSSNQNIKKFNLLFPDVKDLPQNDKSYTLISSITGEVMKISLSLDFGNISFIKKE